MNIYEAERHLSSLILEKLRTLTKGQNPSSELLQEISKAEVLIQKLKKEERDFFVNRAKSEKQQRLKALKSLSDSIHSITVSDLADYNFDVTECYKQLKAACLMKKWKISLESGEELTLTTKLFGGKKKLIKKYSSWEQETFEIVFSINQSMLFDEFLKTIEMVSFDFTEYHSNFGHGVEKSYTPSAVQIVGQLLSAFKKI